MKKLFIIGLIVIVIVMFTACAADPIGIRGKVTSLTENNDSVTILVEGNVEKDTSFDKASVTLDNETAVFIRKDSSDKSADKSDIKEGDTVEVVFTGAVAESYPVQGRAKKVVILSQAD